MASKKRSESQPFAAASPFSAPSAPPPPYDKKTNQTKDDTYTYTPSSGETGAVYSSGSILDSRYGRIVMLATVGVLVVMFILAFSFCLAGAIKYKEAKYFALLINITISTCVTGALILCLYRKVLAASMVWYIFVQCMFLFFQCVTTDVFAWYEGTTASPTPTSTTPGQIIGPNCTNKTRYKDCTNSPTSTPTPTHTVI